jgi:hypothetical protein
MQSLKKQHTQQQTARQQQWQRQQLQCQVTNGTSGAAYATCLSQQHLLLLHQHVWVPG